MRSLLLFVLLTVATVLGDLQVYDGTKGQLVNSFENWSWATVSLTSTDYVSPGNKYSISVVCAGYQALYIHTNVGFTTKQYTYLNFVIHGGANGGENVNVQFVSGTNGVGIVNSLTKYIGSSIPAKAWKNVSIPLADFGVSGVTLNGFYLQAGTDAATGTIYVDDLVFVQAPPAPITDVNVVIDIAKNRHAFSTLIYGVNFATADQLKKNKYTVNRWGGEAMTRYAWDVDATNHASDWFFENLPEATPNPATLPNNSTADIFVRDAFSNNALPLITIPLIGYTPIDRQVRCGFSVKKYGAQQSTDVYQPDCGNGIKPDGSFITGNDWSDTSRRIDETFILKWIAHLEQVFGKDKVSHFELDNEPGLWQNIHRDVHPQPISYDELWNKTVTYAGAIKKAYPKSKLYGPVPWGWCEYMFSPLDGCSDGPDKKAHDNLPLLQWYIQQVGAYKAKYGVQLVDVIDIHIYPQETDVWSDKQDANTAALRFRSTRAIWDSSYTDESWIGQPIYIVPRVQQWIDKYAPGLSIAVSEYDWGADDIITGALAQVMILGIFAQQNVYVGTRWIRPDSNTKTEQAFQLYTNYDGKGAIVQGDSVFASSDNEDEVSAYGFYNKGKLFVTMINKRGDGPVTVYVSIGTAFNSTKTTAQEYAFSASENVNYKGTVSVASGKIKTTLAAWSAKLIVYDSL